MKMKITTIILALAMSLFPSVSHAFDEPSVEINLTIGEKTIYINDVPTEIDAAPILRNSRTMVPIRVIAEALGAEVKWTTWMLKDAVSINPSDSAYSYYIVIGDENVMVWNNPFHEDFDPNREINNKLDSPAFVENDRTYLPLRFVAESLEAEVKWNNETQTVTISKNSL